MDVTAFADAIKNVLPGHADLSITMVGHLDNTADTGFHVVMSANNGGVTALSMDIQIGIRHAWESGEPQFGITSSATSGMIVTSYVVNLDAMEGTATLKVFGATAPAWATTAET